MTMNERIIGAVSELAPCYPWANYEGGLDDKLSRYFVFNWSTVPKVFGDDDVPYDLYLIQLHYFCPLGDNTVSLRRKVKKLIQDAGFTRPSETAASDEEGQHYVFEFEDVEYNGDLGD